MNENSNNNNGLSPLDELRMINERVGGDQRPAPRPVQKPQIRRAPVPRAAQPQTAANAHMPASPQMPPQRRQAAKATQIKHPVPRGQSAASQPTQMINTEEVIRTANGNSAAAHSGQRAGDVRRVRAASVERAERSASSTRNMPSVKKDSVAKPSAKKEKEKDENRGKGAVSSTVKGVIYLVAVLVISGFLSLFVILVGNDVFALVKDSNEVVVTIPEGADLSDIAEVLGENNIVKYPGFFKFYVNFRHKGADHYLSGSFTVSPSMPYDMLIATFKESAARRKEITITFTEGMTVDEIIDKFLENGIGTRERFVDVIQNYDFDYWFIKELDKSIAAHPDSGRKYRLEGYLFPDTYNFYSDSTEETAIARLLDNFAVKFDDNYRLGAEQQGMTVDQVVTLASIIQKEAKFVADYPIVSSVFHNRLDNPSRTDGKLESNATVQYTMPKEDVRLELTVEEIQKYDNAYNTYLYPGLPVGAICNPSINAINFALYPQDTDYYYFISDSSGANLYARTWEEHARNRQKVEAESGS